MKYIIIILTILLFFSCSLALRNNPLDPLAGEYNEGDNFVTYTYSNLIYHNDDEYSMLGNTYSGDWLQLSTPLIKTDKYVAVLWQYGSKYCNIINWGTNIVVSDNLVQVLDPNHSYSGLNLKVKVYFEEYINCITNTTGSIKTQSVTITRDRYYKINTYYTSYYNNWIYLSHYYANINRTVALAYQFGVSWIGITDWGTNIIKTDNLIKLLDAPATYNGEVVRVRISWQIQSNYIQE